MVAADSFACSVEIEKQTSRILNCKIKRGLIKIITIHLWVAGKPEKSALCFHFKRKNMNPSLYTEGKWNGMWHQNKAFVNLRMVCVFSSAKFITINYSGGCRFFIGIKHLILRNVIHRTLGNIAVTF